MAINYNNGNKNFVLKTTPLEIKNGISLKTKIYNYGRNESLVLQNEKTEAGLKDGDKFVSIFKENKYCTKNFYRNYYTIYKDGSAKKTYIKEFYSDGTTSERIFIDLGFKGLVVKESGEAKYICYYTNGDYDLFNEEGLFLSNIKNTLNTLVNSSCISKQRWVACSDCDCDSCDYSSYSDGTSTSSTSSTSSTASTNDDSCVDVCSDGYTGGGYTEFTSGYTNSDGTTTSVYTTYTDSSKTEVVATTTYTGPADGNITADSEHGVLITGNGTEIEIGSNTTYVGGSTGYNGSYLYCDDEEGSCGDCDCDDPCMECESSISDLDTDNDDCNMCNDSSFFD